MLLIQMQKVLMSNQYTVIGIDRTFNVNGDTCFEVFFAGPASRIPARYLQQRILRTYPDKNGSQVIELEVRR